MIPDQNFSPEDYSALWFLIKEVSSAVNKVFKDFSEKFLVLGKWFWKMENNLLEKAWDFYAKFLSLREFNTLIHDQGSFVSS